MLIEELEGNGDHLRDISGGEGGGDLLCAREPLGRMWFKW